MLRCWRDKDAAKSTKTGAGKKAAGTASKKASAASRDVRNAPLTRSIICDVQTAASKESGASDASEEDSEEVDDAQLKDSLNMQ